LSNEYEEFRRLQRRRSFATAELSGKRVQAIGASRMDKRHAHLNAVHKPKYAGRAFRYIGFILRDARKCALLRMRSGGIRFRYSALPAACGGLSPSSLRAKRSNPFLLSIVKMDCFAALAMTLMDLALPTRRRPCMRQINPTGKISLAPSGKTFLKLTHPVPKEGALAIVTERWDGMRWTLRHRARDGIAGRDKLRERSLGRADERC
jgi:hypothetical protein